MSAAVQPWLDLSEHLAGRYLLHACVIPQVPDKCTAYLLLMFHRNRTTLVFPFSRGCRWRFKGRLSCCSIASDEAPWTFGTSVAPLRCAAEAQEKNVYGFCLTFSPGPPNLSTTVQGRTEELEMRVPLPVQPRRACRMYVQEGMRAYACCIDCCVGAAEASLARMTYFHNSYLWHSPSPLT